MSPARPPRWAGFLAERLIVGPTREWVLGDLDELYAAWVATEGRTRATLRYTLWALRSASQAAPRTLFVGLRGDVRVGLRQFRRSPRVFLGGALVLAVGLGMSALTWGVLYGTLWRDLPVSAPDRMMSVRIFGSETNETLQGVSLADLEEIRAGVPGFDEVGLWSSTTVTLTDSEGPAASVESEEVTPSTLRLLELRPLHGRLLQAADALPGSPRVALLGYRFWTARYGGDRSVVGTSIRVDGALTTIVGVLPEGAGFTAHEDLWRPFGAYGDPEDRDHYLIARAGPGVDSSALTASLSALAGHLAESGREEWAGLDMSARSFLSSFYGSTLNPRNRVLAGAGILLFIMALANVANLFLVHAQARAREVAVRRALGATRFQIMRQLAIQALVPAVLGFVGAAVVAALALEWYQSASDAYGIGFVWQRYRLEWPHLLMLASACLASTVFVSMVGSARELRDEGGSSLRDGRGTKGGRFRLGQGFLAVEVAVGGALLLVVSLMVRSAWNLHTVDFGFATEAVWTGDMALRGPAYADPESRRHFWETLQEGLAELPGVQSASVGTQLPMIRCCGSQRAIEVEGWEFQEPGELPRHYANAVGPGYFETFQSPVLAGRAITRADLSDSAPIALVNVHFADKFFPRQVAIGKRLRIWRDGEPGPWRTIVGLAPHLWMDSDPNVVPEGIYLPLAQVAPASASFAIRVADPAGAYAQSVTAIVAQIDPGLPVDFVRSMPQLIRRRTALYRRDGPLFMLIGSAAFVLAIAGLYAVVSYMSSLRIPEYGLRSALGASRRELIQRSALTGVLATVIGAVAGLAIGLWLMRGFDRLLFMVDPWNPWVVLASVGILASSSLVASLFPALRASRVDLVEVLKAD